jgi:hypothetical protein
MSLFILFIFFRKLTCERLLHVWGWHWSWEAGLKCFSYYRAGVYQILMLPAWRYDSLTFHMSTCLYAVTFHKRTNVDDSKTLHLKRSKLSRRLDVTQRHRYAHCSIQLPPITRNERRVINFQVFFCFSETKHTRRARARRWRWTSRPPSFTAHTGRVWFRIISGRLFFSTEKCYPFPPVIGHVTRCIGLLSSRFLLLLHSLLTQHWS